MDIVILTTRYPYSFRKEFIDDEIKYISNVFDNVYVISECCETNLLYELPYNCKAIHVRKKKYSILILIKAFFSLFSPSVLRELLFASNKLHFKKITSNLKEIYVYKYYEILYANIIKSLNLEKKDTVYYSYWLEHKAYALAQLKRKKIISFAISRAHGFDCFIDRGYLPYRREIIEQMDIIIPVSDAGTDDIIKKLVPFCMGVHAKILTGRLGVNNVEGIKNKPNYGKGYLKIVTCSNMVPIKRIDMIIDALSLIENIAIDWTHIGGGELSNLLKEYSRKTIGKKDNIKYQFLGQIKNTEIIKYYQENSIDLFINCSDAEGLPVSIMEAFSVGIPVVARSVGGIAELVNRDNGFLLSSNITPSDISNAIIEYFHLSDSKKNNLRNEAFYTYQQYCDASHNGNKLYSYLLNFFMRNNA